DAWSSEGLGWRSGRADPSCRVLARRSRVALGTGWPPLAALGAFVPGFDMPRPTVNELVRALARALMPLTEVKAAYLFGSHANDRARPDSDIDVAVLFGAAPAPDERKAKLGQ